MIYINALKNYQHFFGSNTKWIRLIFFPFSTRLKQKKIFYFLYLKANFIHLFIYSLIFENSLNLFLCLYLAMKLHLWFNRLPGSKYDIICIFSSKHKLHLPSKQLRVVDLFNKLHWISGGKPIFFNFQKCLDKAVWFLKRWLEKEWIWLLYLNLQLTD